MRRLEFKVVAGSKAHVDLLAAREDRSPQTVTVQSYWQEPPVDVYFSGVRIEAPAESSVSVGRDMAIESISAPDENGHVTVVFRQVKPSLD